MLTGTVMLNLFTATSVILTPVWPQWTEGIFGLDLDSGGGSSERLVVLGLLAATLILSALARRKWRDLSNVATSVSLLP
jgi:hypothetical protein